MTTQLELPARAATMTDFPHWIIRFEANDGMFHPVWVGCAEGPNISHKNVKRIAGEYLLVNKRFLKRIDHIGHWKSTTCYNAKPAFDGATYSPERDYDRLSGQLKRVFMFMRDGQWKTIPQIAEAAGGSPQAVSARLRDLRKAKYGGHTVERKYVSDGVFEYRLTQ